jgi:hypothetical protein
MEEFKMTMNPIPGQKWWKIGAAAFLSVGLLGACGNGDNDSEVDNEMEEEVEEEDAE